MAFKWKCSENDNGNNTAAPCHECASAFFVLRHFPKHFFILFSHPESVVCKTPPALHIRAYSHSTSQPAESTWKQFSFNQVHYKGPSDANLSNTTILFLFFVFFVSRISLQLYYIDFFMSVKIYCSWQNEVSLYWLSEPIHRLHFIVPIIQMYAYIFTLNIYKS